MKKRLCVLLTLTALNGMNPGLAATMPLATVVANSSTGDVLVYDGLYTESAWQGVALPPEVMMALGDPRKMGLTAGDLPSNVTVSVRPSHAAGVVGLKVSRKDKTQAVHQMGTLTLSNPATGYSYAVQALVIGQERSAK
ncbi:hypothetical protein ACFP9V_26065 [Deinococcus radiopugnans]|uniref:Uncharacterized protein n=1 Tax=Deinococcus radiopugnans ATCC 19172 TaxID=585398 RepID=A0A5C4XWU5_9DEIO|nr:hypothetical protein [Deinococcus radiopugnans]MBB6018174.1 hypothetical protein [Deinococcus radiopugnans ATCC 19172]TNM68144.1 hypothetical protein FHR04_16925 [Deinococcus radiopugnans ATCC 19172]